MFELLGRTITSGAGASFIASSNRSTLGFMVWPPETITCAPRLSNRLSSPGPGDTTTIAVDSSSAVCSGWTGEAWPIIKS